jgi:DNA-binding NtrC family response regulator
MDVKKINPMEPTNLHRLLDASASEIITHFMEHHGGVTTHVATILGVSRTTLHEMIKRLGITHVKQRKVRIYSMAKKAKAAKVAPKSKPKAKKK